jgi:transcriptional regulator with XRE-family HTH domain
MRNNYGAKVAARIRELRVGRGWSLRELARRSGLPPESVSRSERGLTEITITSLAKVCAGLEIDLPTFFDFAKDEKLDRLTPAARRAVSLLRPLAEPQADELVRGLEMVMHAAKPAGRRRKPHAKAAAVKVE